MRDMQRGDLVDWAEYPATRSWDTGLPDPTLGEGGRCASDVCVERHRLKSLISAADATQAIVNAVKADVQRGTSATRRPFQSGDMVVFSKNPAHTTTLGTVVRWDSHFNGFEVRWMYGDGDAISTYPGDCLRHATAEEQQRHIKARVLAAYLGLSKTLTPSQPSFRCQHFPSAIDNWYAGIQLCKYGCTDYKLEPWHNGTRRAK